MLPIRNVLFSQAFKSFVCSCFKVFRPGLTYSYYLHPEPLKYSDLYYYWDFLCSVYYISKTAHMRKTNFFGIYFVSGSWNLSLIPMDFLLIRFFRIFFRILIIFFHEASVLWFFWSRFFSSLGGFFPTTWNCVLHTGILSTWGCPTSQIHPSDPTTCLQFMMLYRKEH